MKSRNAVLYNPLVRIFTTLIFCLMFIAPFTDTFFTYYDHVVKIVYIIIAIYVFAKKIYDVIWEVKRL